MKKILTQIVYRKLTLIVMLTVAAFLTGSTTSGQGYFTLTTGAGYVWNNFIGPNAYRANSVGPVYVAFLLNLNGSGLGPAVAAATGLTSVPTNYYPNQLLGNPWGAILNDPNYQFATNATLGSIVIATTSTAGGITAGANNVQDQPILGTSSGGGTINMFSIAWDAHYATPWAAAEANAAVGWSGVLAYPYQRAAAGPTAWGTQWDRSGNGSGRYGVAPIYSWGANIVESQAVATGDSATLNVTAYSPSSSVFDYQWYFQGTPLSNATNSSLSFTNLQVTNAGVYTVVVSNSCGSIRRSAVLQVLPPGAPSIQLNGQLAAGTMTVVAPALVTVSGGFSNGFIFYTLDGSTPTTSSTLYGGPFTLANSTMVQAMSLSADFSKTAMADPVMVQIGPAYNLQTSVSGNGGISAYPAGGSYASNSLVELGAFGTQGWAFDHWTGDVTGSVNPTSLTMNGPRSVQAVFVPSAYPLTISAPGGGGVTGNGQVIAPGTYYPIGSLVTLTATASNGWSFLGWQGDAGGTNNPLNLTVNQSNNIQAVFGTIVGANTVGSGGVLFNQPNPIPFGTTLTASAVPNAGNYFVTWGGAASGTNTPTSILVTNANPTVSALFSALPSGKFSLAAVVMGNGALTISPQQNYYNPGDIVTLGASTTNAGTSFCGWTGDASGTNSSIVILMNTSKIVQATFVQSNMVAPATVSVSPLSSIVFGGSNAVLAASAAGLPPLTYQWQNSLGAIAGATNATFTILNAQATNTDNYSVIVSNPLGSVTSAVATVTVVFPPSIILQPISQTVAAGTPVTLEVRAEGTPPRFYQWFDSLGPIPGATSLSYNLDAAQTNDWDNYFVTVSNAYGMVTSTSATLIVYAPVTIITPPMSQVVPYNAPVSFGVVASGFPAPTAYQWTFNGTNLPGAISNSFSLPHVRVKDLGYYGVTVGNGYSSTNSSLASLNMSPSLTSPFIGAVTIWGRDATLSVGALGSGALDYQWYKDGVAIAGANLPMLDFPSIQFTNGGLYSVVVSSPYGAVTNVASQIVVNAAGVSLGFYPGLTLDGVVGYSYIIQSTPDLSNTNAWVTKTNLTLTQPEQIWVDTSVEATSPFNTKYFYRVLPGQ